MIWALKFNGSPQYAKLFKDAGTTTIYTNMHTSSGRTTFEYIFGIAFTGTSIRLLGYSVNYSSYFNISTSNVSFRMGSTSSTLVTIPCSPINDGELHHYKVQRDGVNFYVYIDGVLSGSTTSSVNGGGTSVDVIGRNSSAYSNPFDLAYFICKDAIDGTELYNFNADLSDRSTLYLSGSVADETAIGQNMPTDGSAWVDLGVVTTEETYNFSASINITPTLSALSSKNTNCLAEISQNTALTASLKKQTNISGGINLKPQQQATQTKKVNYLVEISQSALLTTSLEKNTNVNGTINQTNQTQATQNKQVALTAEIAQNYVMYGYFSTEVIEIHQFSATISVTPTTSANFNKKTNHESEITQTTELNSQVTKKALLQFNDQQKITLSANIDKYINITAQLQQPIALNAIFYNLTAPVHIYKFRINGRIVFQRFNGATVSQRFNGVIH